MDNSFVFVDANPNILNIPTTEMQVDVHPLNIKSMHVVSNIRNRYARTVVTSKYLNNETIAQEATFSLVLPDTAFIAGFVMEIKDKKYEAYVKEKKKAKQEYDAAVSRGLGAAHVAVSARDSNKFTVAANVEPQSDVTFILTYEELLVRKHGRYEIVINLHPTQYIDDLQVDVHINETRPVVHVETPAFRSGNEITTQVTRNEYATISKDEDEKVHINFNPTVDQQMEMAKALKAANKKVNDTEESTDKGKIAGISGQFVVQYDVERDPLGGEVLVQDGYFVHFFAPTDLKPIPKHVIFVLDVSGSMGGTKLKQLKEAMTVILDELNPEDYFNLVKFSDNISVLNSNFKWDEIQIPAESKLPKSFAVNDKNIKSVKAVLKQMTEEGCTNIYDALIVGLRMTSKGILHLPEDDNKHKPQPIIVFLTDGQPNVSESNPDKIIEMVGNRNDSDNRAAIFALAFGDDADATFLKELAIQNSGFSRHIYEAADASLQLQDFYKQISSPLLTNVKFNYAEGLKVRDLTRHKFDILFDGSEFVVAGIVDDMEDGFVFVEASSFIELSDKFCPYIINTKPNNTEECGSLERLWAYMTINQLLDKKYEKVESDENISINNQSDKDKTKEQTESAENQALKLALKFSFVTPVTSLVVVKPDNPTVEQNVEKSCCIGRLSSVLDSSDGDARSRSRSRSRSGRFRSLSDSDDDPRSRLRSGRFRSLSDSDDARSGRLRSLSDSSDDEDEARLGRSRSLSDNSDDEMILQSRVHHISDIVAGPAVTKSYICRKRRSIAMKSKTSNLLAKIKRFSTGKSVNSNENIVKLGNILISCDVKDHIAKIEETRTYRNLSANPEDIIYSIILPEETVVTQFYLKGAQTFEGIGLHEAEALNEYQTAISNRLDAALVNLQDSNRVTVNVHIMPGSEVMLILHYQKRLENKNNKYDLNINLHNEEFIENVTVTVTLVEEETTIIKNILPQFKFQNKVIENKHATVSRTCDNIVTIGFVATEAIQGEIGNTLETTDKFSCLFNVEYEVEPDISNIQAPQTDATTALPFPYLIAVKDKNVILKI